MQQKTGLELEKFTNAVNTLKERNIEVSDCLIFCFKIYLLRVFIPIV